MTTPDHRAEALVELLVEPFRENEPGPHVRAAIGALDAAGMDPEMGPFATTARGDLDRAIEAVAAALRAGFDHGADAMQLRIERGS